MEKRNLVFYKKSGKEWTLEEFNNIMEYVGEEKISTNEEISCWDTSMDEQKNRKFIFNNGVSMFFWGQQEKDINFNDHKQVAYEDIFGEPKC